jgi:alkylation response protein AidB-like acyl-CoA dehydrogenase
MLNFELQPLTEPGRRFVEACEQCAETFAGRAAAADRAGKFPVENIDTLRSGGLIGAAVPEEFGGMGVDSLHDLALGVSRLGRADSAMAIAYNMHLTISWSVARFWRTLQLDALADQLKVIAAGQIIAIGGTEAATSLSFPLTTAVPDERGWRINGRKIFGTLSPVTDHFVFAVRVDTGDGNPQVGNAFAPANTPGLTVLDNWDALGMRASGSNDLVLEDVIIPADALIPSGPWGVWNIVELQNLAAGNIVLIGAFLGIAETARDIAVEMLRTRKKVPDTDVLAHRSALQHGTADGDRSGDNARVHQPNRDSRR